MLTPCMLQYNNTLYSTSILLEATSHYHPSGALQDRGIIPTVKASPIQGIKGERVQTWGVVEMAKIRTKGQ